MTKVLDRDLEKDPLSRVEVHLVSREPEIISADAQIASPKNPIFHRLDVPTVGLPFTRELQQLDQLQNLIDKTQDFIPFLYSYRSISRAINSNESLKSVSTDPELQVEMMDLYNNLFKPRLDKILELQIALQDAADTLNLFVERAVKGEFTPSCVFYEKLIEFLDVVFNLDQMKQLKTGLTNDLSFFRRQRNLPPEMQDSTGKAQFFLGTRFFALNKIKETAMVKNCAKEPKYAKFFIDFLDFCCSYHKITILPRKQQAIVISMVTVLFVFETRHLTFKDNLNQVLTIISKCPIVPLYAEMNFKPFEVLKESPTFKVDSVPRGVSMATTNDEIKQFRSQYLIKENMSKFREAFTKSLSKISVVARTGKIDDINIIYQTIQCIATMASAIMNQSAFKFALPASGSDSFYDSRVKNNYTKEDLDVLIELIGDLKTLTGFALKSEQAVMQFIYYHVSSYIQDFLLHQVENTVQSAIKKKEKDVASVLEAIQNIFVNQKEKKEFKYVPPSIHQLDILRSQIHGLTKSTSLFYDKKEKLRPCIKKDTIESFNKFIDETQKFYSVLNFSQVIRDATNLGSLWFRETSLDIENKIQFPVRSSLPFILAEHVLSSSNKPGLHDSVFFPFEIYNDAASLAINVFNSQFLYKEIEAEVSLCVEMISFTFAQAFFKFSRESAAAAELPPECFGQIIPTPIRYSLMVKQSKLQILGSSINFNMVTTQKVNEMLEKELSQLVANLTDFRMIPFVNDIVKVIRTTHQFLFKNGLLLDDFDQIWRSARGAIQPLSPVSSLAASIINALDIGHMTFNTITRRFLPTKELNLQPPSNENWARLYTRLHSQDTKFIGAEHLEALVDLLDEGELSAFVSNCLGRIEEQVQKSIDLYLQVASAIRLLPAKSKDDLVGYYSFISDAYSEVSHPLLGQLYNSLRNVGNLVAIIFMLETELHPVGGNLSLMASVAQIIRDNLLLNKNLFATQEFEYDNVITHRTFPALWSVLEFLLCSPGPVKLSDTLTTASPISVFGDGVIVAAHSLILLAGEKGLYEYDSVVNQTLKLYDVQKISPKGDLKSFCYHASIISQAKDFTEIMIYPFISTLPPL
ncbi:hypothetical protein TRFO_40768 [Tritrichomonas foetus]|uniref:CYRIA/CYRIB Rac1 binding domain-containing protein n=1 Tax=Tritrichomonas foetus TaxID=1144522 RepID=A0A1J4IZZ2_9EUKA|nr:hypothetical protein TRFO_40768 [Tritrichomonas foetus]|eukprot:OHS92912.1 hypothetical protein TRFO_40768 [Tritrichomonas foetus]